MTVKISSEDAHAALDTIGGTATLTVHKHLGPYCLQVASFVLDPDQVLELATELTRASVPPPPVVRRRLRVEREGAGWVVKCPECLPLGGTYINQESALTGAERHLRNEHASEMAS